MILDRSDEFFMKEAIKEARIAFEADEIPIGAIVVANNQIIARAHNLTERLTDVTAHAEMQAITAASNYLGGKYLNECAIYITIEPCIMCAGALAWAQIGKVVFGASDNRRGYSNFGNQILHPKTQVVSLILQEECSKMMKIFFEGKRNN